MSSGGKKLIAASMKKHIASEEAQIQGCLLLTGLAATGMNKGHFFSTRFFCKHK